MPVIRSFFIVFVLSLSAHANPTYDVNSVEPGGLYFATEKPGRVVAAPTLKADVDMSVSGPIVRTRVTQYFENTGDAWVEGIYTYPLPKGSAIDVLKMQVGDRTIEGEIKEKEDAKRTFEKARDEGKRASLVVQRRPNIFSTRIANIGPGETIKIVIEYQDLIEPRDNVFELRFPMVVRPRYNPGVPLDDFQARAGWGFDTDQVPDGSKLNPAWIDGAKYGHNPVSLSVALAPGFELAQVDSPSHDVSVIDLEGGVQIRLSDDAVPADRDFVLRWIPKANTAPQIGVFEESTDAGKHHLVMLTPPTETNGQQDVPARELIIVLDKSGSMGGQAIRQAKAAVRRAVMRLTSKDSFNLIAFDSFAQALFPKSQPVTDWTIDTALDFIGNVQADGGTEMSDALSLALPSSETPSQKIRQVIFVTDGAVGNEAALMAQIKQNLGSARLFTVGIGSAPNSHFMSEAAHFGRGTYVNIAMQDDVMTAMAGLFAKIEKPQITGLDVSGLPEGIDMAPVSLPDLYAGEPIVVALKGDLDTDQLVVTGTKGGMPWSMEVPAAKGGNSAGIANLWARRKIRSVNRSFVGQHGQDAMDAKRAQVTKLALDYHLVSDFTSLVAVEKQSVRPINDPLFKREVRQNLPAGMDWAQRKRMTITRGLLATPKLSVEQLAVRPRGTASPMKIYLMLGTLLLLTSTLLLISTRRRKVVV